MSIVPSGKHDINEINKSNEKILNRTLLKAVIEHDNEKYCQLLAKKFNKPVWLMRAEWFLTILDF